MNNDLPQWVNEKINDLITPQYYGKLCLHFKNGKVVLIREERTYVKDEHDSQESTGDQ